MKYCFYIYKYVANLRYFTKGIYKKRSNSAPRYSNLLILLCIYGLMPGSAVSMDLQYLLKQDPVLQPLAKEAACIVNVTRYYQLNLGQFLAILRTEGGRTGTRSLNKNGTYDYGPAQINSTWIHRFRKRGIHVTDDLLQNNACFNLYVSGWIQRYEMDRAPDYWTGVARYHSRDTKLQKIYLQKVYHNWHYIAKLAKR